MAVVGDIYNALDAFCPFDVHEQWDNVGMLVGESSAQVTKAAVVLDITPDAVERAHEAGAQLIISHQPVNSIPDSTRRRHTNLQGIQEIFIRMLCLIISGISVGYMSLLINIPLAVLVFFKVSKPIAVRSMVYVVVFSVGLLILDKVDLSAIAYSTKNGTSRILGPLTAGIIMGYVYAILMKASAYTGGTDFVAAIIHSKYPEKSVYGLSFIMNAMVAVASYFVYDFKVEPELQAE